MRTKKSLLYMVSIFLLFSIFYACALENTAHEYTGSVDFPELFRYSNQKNANLEIALFSISHSFKDNSVPITQELLAAIMATLDKEVGANYLPVEEQGDYGMGLGSTYKIGGSRRSTPYEGGVDYKGRGYIQITHKSNYQKYCGLECIGTSAPELDVCGCKNQKYCTVTDDSKCPQIKALQPDYAARIFASYYIENNLVSLSNSNSYRTVGKIINGGNAYASDFNTKANAYLMLFLNNPDKTTKLLTWLNSDVSAKGSIHPSQVLSPVIGDIEQIGPNGSCSNTKWCFNQHQTGRAIGHIPSGGICQADDTYAWDVNLNMPTWDYDQGQPVYAVAEGVVCQTYGDCKNADDTSSYGQVLIEHSYQGNRWWSGYVHLSNIQVTKGQAVTENTIIGYISNAGTDNNHLHFVVYTGENTQKMLRSFNARILPRSESQSVALTLYVHDGDPYGPIISGTQVSGQDESGNSFQKITNDYGFVTIEGSPGTWQFTIFKEGYNPISWIQDITTTCTKHAYFQEVKSDSISPVVEDFSVAPTSLTLGESIEISYTVSDEGGSGLKQVELWRRDQANDWQEIDRTYAIEGIAPVSGSLQDNPSASGSYWYGLHVVDNANNWNDEKNSNSNNQPGIYGPIKVLITGKELPVNCRWCCEEGALMKSRESGILPQLTPEENAEIVSKCQQAGCIDYYNQGLTTGTCGSTINVPASLNQLKLDGTSISVGDQVADRSVAFKARINDFNGRKLRLQVELRRLDEYGGQFDDSKGGLKESDPVESGEKATAYAHGLINGYYHWRARAIDDAGRTSNWVDFGNNQGYADFAVFGQSIEPPGFDEDNSIDEDNSNQETDGESKGKIYFLSTHYKNDELYMTLNSIEVMEGYAPDYRAGGDWYFQLIDKKQRVLEEEHFSFSRTICADYIDENGQLSGGCWEEEESDLILEIPWHPDAWMITVYDGEGFVRFGPYDVSDLGQEH